MQKPLYFYLIMEIGEQLSEQAQFVVIAKGKLQDCIDRAKSGIEQGHTIAVLGKGSKIGTAISICEILKRQYTLKQESRIFTKEFQGKPHSCIEIKLKQ